MFGALRFKYNLHMTVHDLKNLGWLHLALMMGTPINVHGHTATVLSVERIDTPDLETQSVKTHFEAVVIVQTKESPARGRILIDTQGRVTVTAEIVVAIQQGDNA